jgi:hypothetical protein
VRGFFAVFLGIAIAAGCSSGGGAEASSSGSSGSSGSSTPTGGATASSENPASGSCNGLVPCGGDCVALDEDNRHCGACGNACPSGQVCVAGACKAGTCEESFRNACGPECVRLTENPAHCGACGKACGAGTVCHKSACVNVFGSGASCADPIVMPGGGENVNVSFTFAGATETQLLSCGEPTARPRRVFRFTANKTKDDAKFEIRGGLSSNDLVIEAFSDAPCEKAQSIGCNDDSGKAGELRPVVEVSIQSGKTYFIVVSSKGPPPAGRFYLRFDD